MRERAFLIAWGLAAGFALTLLGRVPAQNPDVKATADRTSRACYYVRYLPVLFRGPSEPYWVEWDLCPKDPDPPENHVKVETDSADNVYNFGPADEIQQLDRLDLVCDGTEQLLWVNRGQGSGSYIDWCVLGWVKDRLRCWDAPSIDDIERTAERVLEKDEDFAAKGWVLKVENKKLILAHGIYRRGEGNCCPSRGGAFVELSPKQASFDITRVWRTSKPEYERWLWGR